MTAIITKVIPPQVPVRKPSREWWVRVHPDPDTHIEAGVVEDNGAVYFVDPNLHGKLDSHIEYRRLAWTTNRQGANFLWSVPLNATDDWTRTALVAMDYARNEWIKIKAGPSGYEALRATAELAPPEWPDWSLIDLLEIAFRDRIILRNGYRITRDPIMALCEYCGYAEATQRHHIKYIPEVTRCVCESCHRIIHGLSGTGIEVNCMDGSPLSRGEDWVGQHPYKWKPIYNAIQR